MGGPSSSVIFSCFCNGMNTPYRFLARYYDELFLPVRSPIDAARKELLRGILPHVETACDLACGTGTTALMLARQGIRMYAVDLSAQMCRRARDKAKVARLPVYVIHADMRSFRLPESVDLVLCEYDALNHIPQQADLAKVASAVCRALRPAGYFFFDVNNARAFKKYWIGNVWVERPSVAVLMRNGHTPQLNRAWSDIDLFVRSGKCWKRDHERVEEICWTSREIRSTFLKAGFDRLQARDASRFWKNPQIARGCRTIYLAQKSA